MLSLFKQSLLTQRKSTQSEEAGMLNDPDIRRALAADHAERLRQSMAAAHRPRRARQPRRWQLGRVLVAAGLRLTREAPRVAEPPPAGQPFGWL